MQARERAAVGDLLVSVARPWRALAHYGLTDRIGGVDKAGIAGAPVTEWLDYDTHYTERYLCIPPADAAAYERSSLLPLAKNLQRPLLLIHGTSDDNEPSLHEDVLPFLGPPRAAEPDAFNAVSIRTLR